MPSTAAFQKFRYTKRVSDWTFLVALLYHHDGNEQGEQQISRLPSRPSLECDTLCEAVYPGIARFCALIGSTNVVHFSTRPTNIVTGALELVYACFGAEGTMAMLRKFQRSVL
jgi:hypothetical protein